MGTMDSGRAVLAPSGSVAVGTAEDPAPVSPQSGDGVFGVDEDEADEEEAGDDVIQVNEDVERKSAAEDRRVVRKLIDPRKPSQAEVAEHELTHIPYRNWCPICVRCRGKDLDHRKAVDEERGVSEYAFDYR